MGEHLSGPTQGELFRVMRSVFIRLCHAVSVIQSERRPVQRDGDVTIYGGPPVNPEGLLVWRVWFDESPQKGVTARSCGATGAGSADKLTYNANGALWDTVPYWVTAKSAFCEIREFTGKIV